MFGHDLFLGFVVAVQDLLDVGGGIFCPAGPNIDLGGATCRGGPAFPSWALGDVGTQAARAATPAMLALMRINERRDKRA